MKEIKIPVVMGDGIGPDTMREACRVVKAAAKIAGVKIRFVKTPMGYSAWFKHGDTLPKESLEIVLKEGGVFFGAVGNRTLDKTIGDKYPEMKPEKRVLMALRKYLGLLYNLRPMIFFKELCSISKSAVLRDNPQDITMEFFRYSDEDIYTGTEDLLKCFPLKIRERIGLKLKEDVTGKETMVTSVSYFTRKKLMRYFRAVFSHAQGKKRPVIIVDKSNIAGVDTFWRIIAKEISKEFPDLPVSFLYIDAAAALLVTDPAKFDAVIACQNMQGDILTDLAAAILGSIGLMSSLLVDPSTGKFFCESGGGSADDLAGKDIANPIGRILAGAMMLEHIGAVRGAKAIRQAVKKVLVDGWRTADIFRKDADDPTKLLGTKAMGAKILEYLHLK